MFRQTEPHTPAITAYFNV